MYRLWQTRFPLTQKADDAGGAGGGGGANDGAGGGAGGSDADAGFSSESASVAFDVAPGDTTAGLDDGDREAHRGETTEVSASADGVNEPPAEGEKPAIAGAKPAIAEAKPAAKPGEKGKKPNKPMTQRVDELKKDIDTLTHTKHKTTAELTRDQESLATARRELAKVQKEIADARKAGAPPVVVPDTTKPAAAAANVEPDLPKYRDFDTDEAYEDALGKWRTEHKAWQQRSLDAVRDELTKGVEARFATEAQHAQQGRAVETLVKTLESVRSTKADWNERAATLKEIRSAWHDPARHGEDPTPFLTDLTRSRLFRGDKEGAEVLYWLGEDAGRAQRLADLLPNRPLRDALVHAPSVLPLLEHFATDDGAAEFDELKRMHPIQMLQAVGALYSRLQPAPGGSGSAVHSITKARPSAKPQAGTPDARGASGGGAAQSGSFDDWMAAEDERELKDRQRLRGVSA